MVQADAGTKRIIGFSQLNMSSLGISSIITKDTTSFKNSCLSLAKSADLWLLLDAVDFRLTKFIQSRRQYTHCLLKVTCPPNSEQVVSGHTTSKPHGQQQAQ